MARIVTYIFVFGGLLALMAMAGLPTDTNQLLSAFAFNDFSNLSASTFYQAMGGLLTIAGVTVAVVVGLYTRQSTESVLVASFAASLGGAFASSMVQIYNYFNGICPVGSSCVFVSKIVLFILFILSSGFVISLIQWWRGNDI